MKRLLGLALTAVCAIIVLLMTMAPEIVVDPPGP